MHQECEAQQEFGLTNQYEKPRQDVGVFSQLNFKNK